MFLAFRWPFGYIRRVSCVAFRVSLAAFPVFAFPVFAGVILPAVAAYIGRGRPRPAAPRFLAAFPKFFFDFFYFCICNRGLQASESRFVFCWLIFVLKTVVFVVFKTLMLECVYDWRFLAIFRAFLDAFASFVGVYMFWL